MRSKYTSPVYGEPHSLHIARLAARAFLLDHLNVMVEALAAEYVIEQAEALHRDRLWKQAQARAGAKRRRDRIKSGRNDLTEAQWEVIKAQWHYRCAYCGASDVDLTKDHVIPLYLKGEHTADNIVPACSPCNDKKGRRRLPQHLRPVPPPDE